MAAPAVNRRIARALGRVLTRPPGGAFAPTGSCVFVTLEGSEALYALTAAHCLIAGGRVLDRSDVELLYGGEQLGGFDLVAVGEPAVATPAAANAPDLALLSLPGLEPPDLEPLEIALRNLHRPLAPGDSLAVGGWPQKSTQREFFSFELATMDPRYRMFQCKSRVKIGMSGGPVVLKAEPDRLVGLITMTSADDTFVLPIHELKQLLARRQVTGLLATYREIERAAEPTYRELCPLPPHFDDRDRELGEVQKFLAVRARKCRGMLVRGPIGTGKSTLVRQCIEGLENGRFEEVLWYRVGREADPVKPIYVSLLGHLGHGDDEVKSMWDREKYEAVASGLLRRKVLVVLDGAENFARDIEEVDGVQWGEIRHEALVRLLAAVGSLGPSRLILTSNVGLKNLGAAIRDFAIGDFGRDHGLAYLTGARLGGDGDRLAALADRLGHNVGKLRLLAAYLKRRPEAALGAADGAAESDGDAFAELLTAYWQVLSPGQKDFLRRLSTRPDGVYDVELPRLFKPDPDVKVGRELTPSLRRVIEDLRDSALIEVEDHPGERVLYRANALCEALFAQRRGEAEGRTTLSRQPIVAATTAPDLLWNPLLSIPPTTAPTPEMGDIVDLLCHHGCRSAIDYGCGIGRHLKPLCARLEEVWASDVEAILGYPRFQKALPALTQLDRFEGFKMFEKLPAGLRVDAALLLYVLHTIPWLEMRQEVLRRVRGLLGEAGLLVVLVPGPKQKYYKIKHQNPVFEDGHRMIRGKRFSFYKEYRPEELQIFVEDQGFDFVDAIAGNHKYIQVFRARQG